MMEMNEGVIGLGTWMENHGILMVVIILGCCFILPSVIAVSLHIRDKYNK